MRPSYLLMFATVLPVMAQTPLLTFGVQGGVPAQTPLGGTNDRMPFVLGPTVTFRILPRLSIETGVMFHRMGTEVNSGAFFYPENALTVYYGTQRGRALEVPILAKVHLVGEHHNWRPFLVAGPTIRRTSVETDYLSTILSGTAVMAITGQPGFSNFNRVSWNVDPAVGVGVDVKTGRFHLEPQVRYSYWGAGTNYLVRKNQVDFLLGFRF